MKKTRAFTLIELLVVIAIIALLLAILMPALKLVKEKAKNLTCRTNIRSLAMGFLVYTEANEGKVFSYGSDSDISGNNLWLVQMEDSIGNINKVRYCPSTKLNKASWGPWGSAEETWIWTSGVTESEHGSYGINGYFYSSTPYWIVPTAEWKASAWKNTNTTGRTSTVPVFTGAIWVDLWPQDNDFVPADHNLATGGLGFDGAGRNHIRRCMIDRHGGKLSVAFLDGHAEAIALKQMWSLKWNRAFVTDTQDHLRTDDTPIYR